MKNEIKVSILTSKIFPLNCLDYAELKILLFRTIMWLHVLKTSFNLQKRDAIITSNFQSCFDIFKDFHFFSAINAVVIEWTIIFKNKCVNFFRYRSFSVFLLRFVDNVEVAMIIIAYVRFHCSSMSIWNIFDVWRYFMFNSLIYFLPSENIRY